MNLLLILKYKPSHNLLSAFILLVRKQNIKKMLVMNI